MQPALWQRREPWLLAACVALGLCLASAWLQREPPSAHESRVRALHMRVQRICAHAQAPLACAARLYQQAHITQQAQP